MVHNRAADATSANGAQPAATPHNLPAQPTPLIGRDELVAEACARLRDPAVRLLTLMGTAGTGKTRLALAVAGAMRDRFADGVWFVGLESVRDPEGINPAIARALGVRETPGQTLPDSVAAHCAGRHLLLVLDNFEQVVDAGVHVAALLAACADVKVLVTSRAPLRLRWEHELPVPPLALPERGRTHDLTAVAGAPSVQLFEQRARAMAPAFRLTAENAATVAAVCTRLDGLPLAIELAAARANLLSPEELLERLESRLDLPRAGARDLPERHQTLRAALTWSYDLLTPAEQVLFRRLAVFAGGWTLATAAALAGNGEDTAGDAPQVAQDSAALSVEDGLAALLDHSLLWVEVGVPGGTRYHMLETVRAYARERLAVEGELAGVQRQHAALCLALAERAEPELRGAAQGEWLTRLEAEHDNLRAALEWALQHGDADTGLRLAGALWWFWNVRGHLAEGRRWLTRLLAMERAAPRLRAQALRAAGTLASSQSDFSAARSLLEQSLSLYRELGDLAGAAAALNELGNVAEAQGDYPAARGYYTECLAASRATESKHTRARALNNLGNIAVREGDHATGRARYEESLALLREIGDTRNIAFALNNLGVIAFYAGDIATARARHEESLALRRSLGDKRGLAASLVNLATVALSQAEYASARSLSEEALALHQEIGNRQGAALARYNLGVAALRQGDLPAAWAHLAESLSARHELGDRFGTAQSLGALAEVVAGRGQPERAARLLGAADALRESIGAAVEPSAQPVLDYLVAGLKRTLGEAAFRAARATGREMPLDEVIDQAGGAPDAPAPSPPARTPRRAETLTAREQEVATLIARGLSNRQIAAELVISERTADAHVANIMGKLGFRNRAQVSAWAVEHGLRPPADA